MFKHSKLSNNKAEKILRCFSEGKTAIEAEEFLNINRNTINRYYNLFRENLKKYCEDRESTLMFNESTLGIYSFKKNTHLLLILTQDRQIYTQILLDLSKETLMSILDGIINIDWEIYTYQKSTYPMLQNCGYENCICKWTKTFRGITFEKIPIDEKFEELKNKFKKFYGVKAKLPLYLKEAEFRLNNEHKSEEDLYKIMLKIIRAFSKN